LVEFEAFLEKVKMQEKSRLKAEYTDMVQWLMMLTRYPKYKILEDNIKPVALAYTHMNDIPVIIYNAENKLRTERDDIENQLVEEKNQFDNELKSIDEEIKKVKGFQVRNHASKYVEEIAELQKRLKQVGEDLKQINEQQVDLDLTVTEAPLIEELKVQLKPFDDLWNLMKEFDLTIKEKYVQSPLNTLNPDDIEGEFKKMQGLALRLTAKFEQSKDPKMAKPK
jgi:dynein heavy chain